MSLAVVQLLLVMGAVQAGWELLLRQTYSPGLMFSPSDWYRAQPQSMLYSRLGDLERYRQGLVTYVTITITYHTVSEQCVVEVMFSFLLKM